MSEFARGVQAFKDGLKFFDNPNGDDVFSPAYCQWEDGFMSAKRHANGQRATAPLPDDKAVELNPVDRTNQALAKKTPTTHAKKPVKGVIQLTKAERAKIDKAINTLNEVLSSLQEKHPETDMNWFLHDMENLNLMQGPSHIKDRPNRDAVVGKWFLMGASGGAW